VTRRSGAHATGARRVAAVALCAGSALAGAPRAAGAIRAARAPEFTVVVHASNPAAALPRELVARLFLRKLTRWPGGGPADPVDLAPGAPARAAFTRAVLGKSVASVRMYWQQRIFSGAEVPPPEKAAEGEALEYVRTHAGAVAYVSATSAVPTGVRALEVTE
jgi:ABC-type phosphate transport system substrate-binding protein